RVGERFFLVDGFDPEGARPGDGEIGDAPPVDHDLPTPVWAVIPGDDLDQRRLAGAVVPEHPHDLIPPDPEVDPLERPHLAERLRDPGEPQQVRGIGRLGSSFHATPQGRLAARRALGAGPRSAWTQPGNSTN